MESAVSCLIRQAVKCNASCLATVLQRVMYAAVKLGTKPVTIGLSVHGCQAGLHNKLPALVQPSRCTPRSTKHLRLRALAPASSDGDALSPRHKVRTSGLVVLCHKQCMTGVDTWCPIAFIYALWAFRFQFQFQCHWEPMGSDDVSFVFGDAAAVPGLTCVRPTSTSGRVRPSAACCAGRVLTRCRDAQVRRGAAAKADA